MSRASRKAAREGLEESRDAMTEDDAGVCEDAWLGIAMGLTVGFVFSRRGAH